MPKREFEWPVIVEYDSVDDALESFVEARRYVFENHLVVIRGMGEMAVQEFAKFAMRFGDAEEPLSNADLHPLDSRVEVMKRTNQDILYQRALKEQAMSDGTRSPSSFFWHADRSFLPSPSSLTITHMAKAPHEGGNTEFINTEIAYAALSEEQKTQLIGLVGIHSYAFYHEHLAGSGAYAPEEISQKQSLYPPAVHGIVQEHPITGRAVAYTSPLTLSGFTDSERGEEARDALAAIQAEDQLAFYSHTWRAGDVVIWDNHGILHRGSPSKGERELQRMTLSLPKGRVS